MPPHLACSSNALEADFAPSDWGDLRTSMLHSVGMNASGTFNANGRVLVFRDRAILLTVTPHNSSVEREAQVPRGATTCGLRCATSSAENIQ